MTPKEKERLQQIEDRWSADTTTDANPRVMASLAFEYDIPWLIALVRKKDDLLHGAKEKERES